MTADSSPADKDRPQKPEGCAECKWPECGCQNSYTPAPPQRSYADRADGATTFDPEAQFEKDNLA